MTTATFKGGLTVSFGDNASPEVFSTIEEVNSLSGFGVTNPLIDATSHDSTAREYIAGLPDGAELTVECNRVHTASNIQDDVKTAVDAGSTRNFRIALTDGTTAKQYDFSAVCLSWAETPSYDDKNMISFTLKISGSITES